MPVTGRFTFRRSLAGKIVLQIEEEVKTFWPGSKKPFRKRWRDANLMDLAAPQLRALIDLRYKPQFMSQFDYLGSEAAQPAEQAEAAVEPSRGADEIPAAAIESPSVRPLRRGNPRTPQVSADSVEQGPGRVWHAG